MRIIAALVVVGVLSPAAAQGQSYSAQEITAAINYGLRNDVGDISHNCRAGTGGWGNLLGQAIGAGIVGGLTGNDDPLESTPWMGVKDWRITGIPPLARIARYARDAQRRYLPTPTADDPVIDELLAGGVFTLTIHPDANDMVSAAQVAETGIEHVVLRRRGDNEGRTTVQPLTIDVAGSETVTNLFGASVTLTGVVATFDSEAVYEIALRRDVEAVLITTSGEFRCNLDDTRLKRGFRPLEHR